MSPYSAIKFLLDCSSKLLSSHCAVQNRRPYWVCLLHPQTPDTGSNHITVGQSRMRKIMHWCQGFGACCWIIWLMYQLSTVSMKSFDFLWNLWKPQQLEPSCTAFQLAPRHCTSHSAAQAVNHTMGQKKMVPRNLVEALRETVAAGKCKCQLRLQVDHFRGIHEYHPWIRFSEAESTKNMSERWERFHRKKPMPDLSSLDAKWLQTAAANQAECL